MHQILTAILFLNCRVFEVAAFFTEFQSLPKFMSSPSQLIIKCDFNVHLAPLNCVSQESFDLLNACVEQTLYCIVLILSNSSPVRLVNWTMPLNFLKNYNTTMLDIVFVPNITSAQTAKRQNTMALRNRA